MRDHQPQRRPVPTEGVTLRDGSPSRRFALTRWMCLRCGTLTPAGTRPACCETMFAVRVDILEPALPTRAAA